MGEHRRCRSVDVYCFCSDGALSRIDISGSDVFWSKPLSLVHGFRHYVQVRFGARTYVEFGIQGLEQATAITSKFGLPKNVLSQILSGGYMPVIEHIVRERTEATLPSLPSKSARHAESSVAMARTSSVQPHSSSQPAFGSSAWRAQLEKIREVCRNADVDHSVIDGFLAASGHGLELGQASSAPEAMCRMGSHASQVVADKPVNTKSGADVEKEGRLMLTGFGSSPGGGTSLPDFQLLDLGNGMFDTDVMGDDMLTAAWAT
jgi:hypothetical protein